MSCNAQCCTSKLISSSNELSCRKLESSTQRISASDIVTVARRGVESARSRRHHPKDRGLFRSAAEVARDAVGERPRQCVAASADRAAARD